jgi:hypothetical protein
MRDGFGVGDWVVLGFCGLVMLSFAILLLIGLVRSAPTKHEHDEAMTGLQREAEVRELNRLYYGHDEWSSQ